MTMLQIDETLLRRLRLIAEADNVSPDQLVEDVLDRFVTAHALDHTSPQQLPEPSEDTEDPLLLIARAADELGLSSREGNIAERSREILHSEYPDYLLRRMKGQD